MSNVRKTLQMTSLLFGMAILFCYIAWHLGYEGFIIVGHIDLPLWILYPICSILLLINWSLQAGFILNEYSWRILYISIPILIINWLGTAFIPDIILTGFMPTLLICVVILYKRLGKKAFIRLFLITIITLIYQWMISQLSVIDLNVNISVYQGFRLSINTILLNLLFFSIGGVKNADGLEHLVFPNFLGHADKSSPDIPQSVDGIPINTFEKLMMRSVIGVVQVIQWMFILWVCSLDNLFLDALVMTTSFICHGLIISKRQHLKPIILCTLAATAMFYFAARFTISFQYSQFFPIVIGLILVYVMYRISYQFEQVVKEKAQNDLKRIEILEKQMDQAWQQLDKLY